MAERTFITKSGGKSERPEERRGGVTKKKRKEKNKCGKERRSSEVME